jgi:hypothetical protein
MADHVETLRLARERLVAHRRRVAGNLADEKVGGGWTKEAAEFVELQAAIAAIDEAIGDEKEREDEAASRAAPEQERQMYEPIDDDPE